MLNLERLVLKKSSNNEIFTRIKKLLYLVLQGKSFRDQNNRNNFVLKSDSHVPENFCQIKIFPSLVQKICLVFKNENK